MGASLHRVLRRSLPPYGVLASHPGLISGSLFLGKTPDSISYFIICTAHLGKSMAGMSPACPTVPYVRPPQP